MRRSPGGNLSRRATGVPVVLGTAVKSTRVIQAAQGRRIAAKAQANAALRSPAMNRKTREALTGLLFTAP